MKTIKVSEATGPVLDWLVAKALGYKQIPAEVLWQPHKNWEFGGPIIEREDISFRKYHNPKRESHGTYYARVCRDSGTLIGWYKTTGFQQTGPTPLVAAMRCFVTLKLGDEVEVPEELRP